MHKDIYNFNRKSIGDGECFGENDNKKPMEIRLKKERNKKMGNVTTKKKHPFGFYTCNLAFTLERLAYFGSKPLMLLFLITAVAEGGLGVDTTEATIIAASLTGYVSLTPILGGYITDNWLGARYAIPIGAVIKGLGFLIGWFATSAFHMELMVLVVALGAGLFNGNMSALQGRLYDDKSMLDSAFSLQYSFTNAGAFIGSLVGGWLYMDLFADGAVLGFRYCFLLSSIFCFAAAIWFVFNWRHLQGQGIKPFKYITDKNGNVIGEQKKEVKTKKKNEPLTSGEKKRVVAIAIVAILSIIFWLFYYQQDLALTIYMTQYVDMHIGSLEIAPMWITTTLNAVLCVALGGVLAAIWKKLASRPQGDLDMFQKVGLGFLLLGCAFGVLVLAEFTRGIGAPDTQKVSVLWLVVFSFLLTVGELSFSPLRNAFVSKYAPKKLLSLLMGIISASTFVSSKLSPYVQAMIEKLDVFTVFVGVFVLLIVCALTMFVIHKKLNKLVEEE